MSAKAASGTKPQVDYTKLIGVWRRYDTGYEGRITQIGILLKDTARLMQKIDFARSHHQCDGGCIYSNTYTDDGRLEEHIDDYGQEYRFFIDTPGNRMTLVWYSRAKPPRHDTFDHVEITYLDDKFLIEYHPGWDKPGSTFYKRVSRQ